MLARTHHKDGVWGVPGREKKTPKKPKLAIASEIVRDFTIRYRKKLSKGC